MLLPITLCAGEIPSMILPVHEKSFPSSPFSRISGSSSCSGLDLCNF
jgi:hypothetical protein